MVEEEEATNDIEKEKPGRQRERTRRRETKEEKRFRKKGVPAVLSAADVTQGKSRDLTTEFAPWRSLVALANAISKGQ